MSSISAGTTINTGLTYTSDTTGTLQIKTGASGATAINVDAAGTVGFGGVTPASWWPSAKQLQLGGATALWDYNGSGNTQTRLSNNLYIDSAAVLRYLNTNIASHYQQYNGAHTFSSALSGSAGAAVTLTDVFSVDGYGNLKMNSGYGSVATAYGCRAWANFAGPTGVLRGNGNVSSITRNATGVYTVNFATAMPDVNYAVNLTTQGDPAYTAQTAVSFFNRSSNAKVVPSTSSFTFSNMRASDSAALDNDYLCVSVFR